MEERTRAYLRGRFRDYYRRASLTLPPAAESREWGYVPWTAAPGMTMVRHRSLLDLGDLPEFLGRESPQHVYYSAGRYEEPDATTMDAKGWINSDLIFDLDADHLPGVTLSEDTYAEMLETCKDALVRLLDFLEDDFGFEELEVVFSGGRGYHVHVRDENVLGLERDQRREIVDYVRGIGLDFESLIRTETVAGMGRKTPAKKRSLDPSGGWSKRAHRRVVEFVDELLELDEEEALERLQSFEGVGSKRAAAALNAARANDDQIRAGNVDVHPAFFGLARTLAAAVVATDNAPIDEPVTTDTNRLIRLPGSLHGGSGLAVRRIERDALCAFDPLVDAVPDTFVGHDIAVDVNEGGTIEVGGEPIDVPEGKTTLPEYAGVFLMARGRAEKGKE